MERQGYTPPLLDQQALPEGEPGGGNGLGARLEAGSEFLNPNRIVDPTSLQHELRAITDGTRAVDIDPLDLYATKQRAEHQKGKTFEQQYQNWSNDFHNWMIGTTLLRESEQQSDKQLYADRVAVLDAFEIDLSTFATASATERQQTIRSYYDNFAKRTKLAAFTEAVLSASQEQNSDVSIPLLDRRLKAIDRLLLQLGGTDVKEAIYAHIMTEGYLNAAEQQTEHFIQTVPNAANTMNEQQQRILSGVYSAYLELHPEPPEPSDDDMPDKPNKQDDNSSKAESQDEETEEITVIIDVATKERSSDRPNEDTNFASPEHRVAGVFDGLGGQAAGEVASKTARDMIEEQLTALPDDISVADAEQKMSEILIGAHHAVLKKATENVAYEGMGTTASAVKILKDGTAIIGNIGDSRVYLLRQGATIIEHCTLDDSFLRSEYVDYEHDEKKAWEAQRIVSNAREVDDIKDRYPQYTRYIPIGKTDVKFLAYISYGMSQSLGHDKPIKPHIYTKKLLPGDRLILTSDGIHDNLIDEEITQDILRNPQTAAYDLVLHAEKTSKLRSYRRAKPDDKTAIIITVAT